MTWGAGSATDLVIARPEGLYCQPGHFYIDPWRPVERAIITHGHADHARSGHAHYLAAASSAGILRSRLGAIELQTLPYGQHIEHNGVKISLHPAGHVLGSAQVRLEYRGEVWVLSGDYKLDHDPTCTAFEPVRCHTFVTESTFGLPVYRWQDPALTLQQINQWWQDNARNNLTSLIYAYSLGKGQRILAGLESGIGPIVTHRAFDALNQVYRNEGVVLPQTSHIEALDAHSLRGALVLAPPSAVVQALTRSRDNSGSAARSWAARLGTFSDAMASGWMQIRGARRRRALDRGFVMSDHADWPSLIKAIQATEAQRVIVTHGSASVLIRWLNENGWQAQRFETAYGTGDDSEEGRSEDGA